MVLKNNNNKKVIDYFEFRLYGTNVFEVKMTDMYFV